MNGIIDDDFGYEKDAEDAEDEELEGHGPKEQSDPQTNGRGVSQPQKNILRAKRNLVKALRDAVSVRDLHLFLNYSCAARTGPKYDELKK